MMMAATFPALSEAVARDPRGARTLHRTALGWLVAAGTTGALVLGLAAEPIIALLYGDAFAASAPILRALAPCVLLTYINYLLTHMLVALGLVRQQMVISLSLVALNVGLNAWWIPLWGGAGAAWATAVTELALLACCVPLVWRGLARAEQAAT
jgi:O-antigen/teichoic acid export membrane protein